MSNASDSPSLTRTVLVCSSFVLLLSALTVALFPPNLSQSWGIAFLTLVALAVFSGALALRRTAGGTTTSLDFIPQLGSLFILGPSGAVFVTAVSEAFSQLLLEDKRPLKSFFNVAQLTGAAAFAGLVYMYLGGTVSQVSPPPLGALPAYIAATIVYFSVNAAAVSYIVALSEDLAPMTVFRRLSGGVGVLAVDIVMSMLGLGIAYLYTEWGALALLLAALPIIGLRYSYGVNIELRQLNQDLLRVLIKALEARDPYTSGHSVRVAERAKLIAEELDLGRQLTRNIETAALLHDIGKIDQAYHDILRKDGPLSDSQRRLIKEHPQRGVNLIRSVRSIDEQILKFVKHHHERYDGTGYPDQLEGDDIPIGARIIMVADTIDAMLTARPYRGALAPSTVADELSNEKGFQFDPEIVEAALDANLLSSDSIETIENATSGPASM